MMPDVPAMSDERRLDQIADRIGHAIEQAATTWHRVEQIGIASAPQERLASNRRVPMPDGRVVPRMSSTQDPALHAAPEGLVDPILRTIALRANGHNLAMLHYFAVHPVSYYGDGRVTFDVAGIAREAVEQRTGVHQVYFTGCGGQIGFGKYNDGRPESRGPLVDRMLEGMNRSIAAIRWGDPGSLDWRVVPLPLEPRSDEGFRRQDCLETLRDHRRSRWEHVKAAADHKADGYEQSWAFGRPCEAGLKRAIDELLTPPSAC